PAGEPDVLDRRAVDDLVERLLELELVEVALDVLDAVAPEEVLLVFEVDGHGVVPGEGCTERQHPVARAEVEDAPGPAVYVRQRPCPLDVALADERPPAFRFETARKVRQAPAERGRRAAQELPGGHRTM